MRMTQRKIFIFLLVICAIKCFDAVFTQTGLFKNLIYAYLFLAIVISIPNFLKYKGGFVLPVQLIALSTVISFIMAKYTWDQSISQSATTIPYMMWFVFFLLLASDLSISSIEKIVMVCGCIYIVLFLFQFTHNGTVYFGRVEEFKEDRGIVRVNFPGAGVFFLACFIAMNKVTSEEKYKFYWSLFALIGLIVTVLQVTRQSIVMLIGIYVFHLLKSASLVGKALITTGSVLIVFMFFVVENPVSRGLVNQQKEDSSYGTDYVRILAAEYFMTSFTPNTASKILGNGFFNDTSKYGKALISISEDYGYYLSDVGIVELYVCFGILAIVGYLLIMIKSFQISVPAEYSYLKYYLWMLFATSFTSDALMSNNFLITTVLVLYCCQYLYAQSELQTQLRTVQKTA